MTRDQRQALQQLRSLLADASLFAGGQALDAAQLERCLPQVLVPPLQELGLLSPAADYRLVSHLGLFLFCHTLSASAKLYYGNDSLALSRLLLPVEGRALDLCTGAGTQALVCAQTAAFVTAVDIEPLAESVFWINAELNGLGDKVEFLVGDLLDPVAGRQFDRICCNPPFMPVPPGVLYPRFADGGPDGLAIVRRLLAGLPHALAPDGLCQVVGAVLGNSDGPDLSALEGMAAGAQLKLELSSPTCEELDDAMLSSCAATALACEGAGDVKQAFRDHWASLGATRIYYFILSATHAHYGAVYFEHDGVHRATIGL